MLAENLVTNDSRCRDKSGRQIMPGQNVKISTIGLQGEFPVVRRDDGNLWILKRYIFEGFGGEEEISETYELVSGFFSNTLEILENS